MSGPSSSDASSGTLKDKTGMCSSVFKENITEKRIADFCAAIGLPVSKEAPPTFMTVFRGGEFELLQKLGLQLSKALHADQHYEYYGPICVGDSIQFETQVSQVLEKTSPKQNMQFLTLETRLQQIGPHEVKLIGKAVATLVFREVLEPK
ncbi:MAG: MaoC family dehydratase N-terminal domain-containing protein [Bdellovibrio sp.]|nr:MaoC family dehydratase N-terminal domain-containing protein [Bdellovibrio sp.]